MRLYSQGKTDYLTRRSYKYSLRTYGLDNTANLYVLTKQANEAKMLRNLAITVSVI